MRNFEPINSYIINWSSHVKKSLHVSMLASNRQIAWSIWSMICNYSSLRSINHISTKSTVISFNLRPLTTSIDVIATTILENGLQIIQINHAFYTIEKKIISIEIERWFHTIQKNDVSYAKKLIADQAIILEKSEMHTENS